jgi:hypothetical protein
MEIAGRQFQKVKLHVIEMNPSIILGCDFLNRTRAELNFEDFTATLWCGTEKVRISGQLEPQQ